MLDQQQVLDLCSATDNAAIFTRAIIASHKYDLDYLRGFFEREPETFDVIIDNAPEAIERAKVILELLEQGERRLQEAKRQATVIM